MGPTIPLMRWRTSNCVMAMVAAAAIAGRAFPQVEQATTSRPRLQGVEQTIEDISPLGTSLRSFQTDLRLPSGFESVYRLPGDSTGRERLMRMDGALIATFPRSDYKDVFVRERFLLFLQRDRKVGEVPTVPPGTVFHIGMPPELIQEADAEDRPRALPETMVAQERVGERIGAEQIALAVPAEEPSQVRRLPGTDRSAVVKRAVTVVPDDAPNVERLPEERLRAMLRRAVEAEKKGSDRQ